MCWNEIESSIDGLLNFAIGLPGLHESQNHLEPFKDAASQPHSRPTGVICVLLLSSSGDFF